MKTTDQGIQLIIEREGKRNDAYLDSEGIPTIGVGHTGPEVHLGLHWTDDQVMEALAHDLERFEAAIAGAVLVTMEYYQNDALVSWALNVGGTAAANSTLVHKLNDGDIEGAALQFDRWHIPPAIIPRRNAEREQFKGTQFVARIP